MPKKSFDLEAGVRRSNQTSNQKSWSSIVWKMAFIMAGIFVLAPLFLLLRKNFSSEKSNKLTVLDEENNSRRDLLNFQSEKIDEKKPVNAQAPIWALTDEFNLVDYPIGDTFSHGISTIIYNDTDPKVTNLLMACGGYYLEGVGCNAFCQSLNTTSESLIPQKYSFSIIENGYCWGAISCALPSYNRVMLGFNDDDKVARQILPTTDFYYLPYLTIDSPTGINDNLFFFTNEINGKEYLEAIWTKASPPTVNYARIDPYDDSISAKGRINIQDSDVQSSGISGAQFADGRYGIIYSLTTSQEDVYVRFFTQDHNGIGTETKISTDVAAHGFQPFLLWVNDYAVAGWGQRQPNPPYPNGFSMRTLDYTKGYIISASEPVFSENQGESSGCAAISIPGGSFVVGCQLPDASLSLKMFSIVSQQITYVPNSQLEINQTPGDNLKFGLLINSQIIAQYKKSTENRFIVGRLFGTRVFAPVWVNSGFKLIITRGVCSQVEYICLTENSCIQATLIVGDPRTINVINNGSPHLQFKKSNQLVSQFSVADVQDDKITVCHDNTVIGTPPEISASITLGYYSSIDGKWIYSDPRFALITVTNQSPKITIPAHALDVGQGEAVEKKLNDYYWDFDGDALAWVNCTDAAGGVCEAWINVYKKVEDWYLKLSPGQGVAPGDKTFYLAYKDARGAVTNQMTVSDVYKLSDGSDTTPVWKSILPAVMTPVGLTGTFLLCTGSACLTLGGGTLCFVGRQQYSERKGKRTARKDDYLAYLVFKGIGAPYDCSDFRGDKGKDFCGAIRSILEVANISEPRVIDINQIKTLATKIATAIKKVIRKHGYHHYIRKFIGFHFSLFLCGCFQPGSTANYLEKNKEAIAEELNELMITRELKPIRRGNSDSTSMATSLLEIETESSEGNEDISKREEGVSSIRVVRDTFYIPADPAVLAKLQAGEYVQLPDENGTNKASSSMQFKRLEKEEPTETGIVEINPKYDLGVPGNTP